MNRMLIKKALFVCAVLALVFVIFYSGLRIVESTIFLQNQDQLLTTSKTIYRDGVKYYPRQDLTVILLMGINRSGKVTETQYNHGGAADMLALMVFNEKTESYYVLNLNRDMMVDMPMLTLSGREAGTYYGQLAYSHTYGDGLEDSCRNVCKTVSNLFYGLHIDYYVALNTDAIVLLNDAVGGVTVDIKDDFSAVDPDLPKGKVLLKGQQALTFVQTRWNVGDELNLSRMERHREYISGFAAQLKPKLGSTSFMADTYNLVANYIVTDCSAETLSRLASSYGAYANEGILTIEGENILNGDYYEFYPDEEALDKLIVDHFYAPK